MTKKESKQIAARAAEIDALVERDIAAGVPYYTTPWGSRILLSAPLGTPDCVAVGPRRMVAPLEAVASVAAVMSRR